MRIRKLEVQNWRGLEGPETLEFGEGVNIIAGPNESGKSSLREALRFALLVPPRARKKEITAVRPWETSLYPRVKAEFDLGGSAWSVEKEFFRTKNHAELHKDGRVVATDDQVQSHLDQALEAAGQWIDVLWGRQGDVEFTVDSPDALRSRLAAAAREAVTPGITWLEERLGKECDRYWTPTGKPKKSLQDLTGDVVAAEARVTEAKRLLEDSNARSEAASSLLSQVEALRQEEDGKARGLDESRRALGAWTAYKTAAAEIEAARQKRLATDVFLARWQRLIGDIQRLWSSARDFQVRVTESEAALGAPATRTEIERLQAEQRYLQALERRRLADKLEALKLPTDMPRLETTESTIVSIERALNMGAVQASLTALAAIEPILERDGDDPEAFAMAAGTKADWDADQSFSLEIPGVAKLEVKSGNADVQAQLGQLVQLEAERASLLSDVGAASVAEVRERVEQAMILRARLGPAPAEDVEALRAEAGALEVADAAERLESLPALVQQGEQAWRTARAEWERRSEAHQALLRDDPRARLETLTQQLELTLAEAPPVPDAPLPGFPARDGWTDADVDRLASIAAPWNQLRARQDEEIGILVAAAVRPPGEEVDTRRLEDMEREVAGVRSRQAELRSELDKTLGALHAQGDLYARRVIEEENLDRVSERERRDRLEARALWLLVEALTDAKNALQRDVVAPLQARVGESLGRLTAGRYRGVQMGNAFDYDGVVPAAVAKAAVDDLSFGTREQLVFLTRLCLAEMLTESGEGQVVVFDDNLVHTDRDRMLAACEMLSLAGRKVQVLVFTCHPERYALDREARVLRVGAAVEPVG